VTVQNIESRDAEGVGDGDGHGHGHGDSDGDVVALEDFADTSALPANPVMECALPESPECALPENPEWEPPEGMPGDQQTEQQQRFVDTFRRRRGWGSGGPIQIRNKDDETLFEVVIPSKWPLSHIGHDSPTMVASMSKVVTGMAAVISMELFQRCNIKIGSHEFSPDLPVHSIGRLDQALPAGSVDEFCRLDPESRSISVKRSWYANDVLQSPITFRHLLSHTAGLPMSLYVKGGLVTNFKNLTFQPGAQFDYGTGYDVAGRALVAIWRTYGKDFRFENARKQPADWDSLNDVADALIFQPLGMSSTAFRAFHEFFEGEGYRTMAWATKNKDTTAKQQHGGRDLQTTGNDFSRFLVMMLNKGGLPKTVLKEQGPVKVFHKDQLMSEDHQLISEGKFTEYVLQNHLPAHWDETEDSMFNKAWGGNSFQGLDHHFGHSLVAAVAVCKPGVAKPQDMFDLRRPRHSEIATHLHWRGMIASVWHIDFTRGMCFTHVTRNPQRMLFVKPRIVEGRPRKTFTVNHDWLIGPLFPVLEELEAAIREPELCRQLSPSVTMGGQVANEDWSKSKKTQRRMPSRSKFMMCL